MKALASALLFIFCSSFAYGAVTRARFLMGTVCEITADNEHEIDAAFDEAARIESMLSTWRDDTDLARVNSGRPTKISSELMELIQTVLKYRQSTNGTFDPLVGPLIEIWQTRGKGAIPSGKAIAEALQRVRSANLLTYGQDVVALQNGARFEEGAFGKGYALDRMLQKINGKTVINFGGQVMVRGRVPVLIADPEDRQRPLLSVNIENESLSTSSGSEHSFAIDGQRFTHIIDARNGYALPPRGSVSVIHRSALIADILSTALYVMGPDEGLRWAREHDVDAIFITKSRQIIRSKGAH